MISFCNQAEELTRQVLEEFYHQNPEMIINKLHSDVTWIGAADGQYINGYDNVSSYIRNIDVPRCEILEKEFQTVANNDNLYIVAGWMRVVTTPESRELLSAVQRITFIWQTEDRQFRLLHFHVSNPIEFQKEDEYFPHTAGKEAFQYVKQMLSQKRKRLIVCGKHNQTHVIWNKEILYIEAENTDSVIHCLHGDILSSESISKLEKKAGEGFIKTHRSFVVNSMYITGIKRYHLLIRQEIELPIPEKKYREIKEKVLRAVAQIQNRNIMTF
ncbi:LytR/AlgR family response regulator transcription factor [Anaerostipes sp.]|uniref:LytR/AlgR family response regulator transcription factor n=1 Tax=Anaerostipes sp. TaxID=1872530 RepID=UPI0025BB407C|nr:LytTR family DNA-binding domain-containing protein [Anaerostipes sp.]MBS7009177.1 LytTR family transcriptional regulator [Anaerostipes sp.]